MHARTQQKSLARVLHAWCAHADDLSWRRSAALQQGQAVSKRLSEQNQLMCFEVSLRGCAQSPAYHYTEVLPILMFCPAEHSQVLLHNQCVKFMFVLHQAWVEAMERCKAGRMRLSALAAELTLSMTAARPSGHAPVTTHSAALLLSTFASWREYGQVRAPHLCVIEKLSTFSSPDDVEMRIRGYLRNNVETMSFGRFKVR